MVGVMLHQYLAASGEEWSEEERSIGVGGEEKSWVALSSGTSLL